MPREKIECSRGRGYQKNDQAYVEQKTWLNVHRHVGYGRYSSKAAYETMQQLYSLLGLYSNCFHPVRKLVGKERHGAKLLKRYDRPLTPYQRLLATNGLDDEDREELVSQYLSLNPAALQRRIDITLAASGHWPPVSKWKARWVSVLMRHHSSFGNTF